MLLRQLPQRPRRPEHPQSLRPPRLRQNGHLARDGSSSAWLSWRCWSLRRPQGWIGSRLLRSETEDAFVEAHIVNVAPQAVSGRLCRFLVEENDHVQQGQVLAEIDPVLYRDKVDLARTKVDEAEAELRRQETSLARLRVEVPIQIEIAKRTLAAAKADLARAKEALRLTTDEVEKSIQEARAGLELAQADLVLAQQEYDRFMALYHREAIPLERSQQVTRARDVAVAQKNLAIRQTRQGRGGPHRGVRGPEGRGSGRKAGPEGRGRREAGGDGK